MHNVDQATIFTNLSVVKTTTKILKYFFLTLDKNYDAEDTNTSS